MTTHKWTQKLDAYRTWFCEHCGTRCQLRKSRGTRQRYFATPEQQERGVCIKDMPKCEPRKNTPAS